MMRIALIADSHLSARAPECVANWNAAARAVERLGADLTVHLGDITLDGQSRPDELAFASQLMQRWPTPIHCVPGNHDMGDGSGETPLQSRLLAAYEAVFGPDHWAVVDAGGWRLLGLNAQLFGSGSPEEAAQWRWIEQQAAGAVPQAPTALFLHRPLARPRPSETTRAGRYVAAQACDRLLSGPLQPTLRLVVSGHTHQYLDFAAAGVRHVWMPSSSFVMPDETQARIGEKLVGIGLLELRDGAMGFDLWCPDGLVRNEMSGMAAFAERRGRLASSGGPQATTTT